MFNLISNAVKFTPVKGKIRLKIKFEKDDEEFHHIKVVVKDSGIGIPSDKIETIFDPFIQVSDDTARKYGGTGLGLTIIKKIINIMNGDIQVKSKLGRGSKFIVNLPFAKRNLNSVDLNSNVNKGKLDVPIASNERVKVLLAEDNRINQILIQKVLSKYNFDCVVVDNGKLAVEAVKHENFDIVLMDIMMPIMDGYEASSNIRNLDDTIKKNIPIVALTAVVTGSVIEACSSVGIDKYLSKPFESEELYNVIMELVDKEGNVNGKNKE